MYILRPYPRIRYHRTSHVRNVDNYTIFVIPVKIPQLSYYSNRNPVGILD